MNFNSTRSVLFSDTQVADIFINEYMVSAEGDFVKVYLYCLFLEKHRKQIAINDLSKKLGLSIERIKQAFAFWENVGVLEKKENGMYLCDLKEKEVNKIYRLKLTSSPIDAKQSTERNKARNEMISAINNTFFQGVMSPTWFIDIDTWFKQYGFDDDVMFSLFRYCYDRHALNRNYLLRVADTWYSKKIKNSFELDNYFILYEKCSDIKKKVSKKLGISKKLSEYEEAYINKWVIEYGFDMDIIELALQKTTATTNATFNYFDGILTRWHEKGLKTPNDIKDAEKNFKQDRQQRSKKTAQLQNKFVGQLQGMDLDKYYDNLAN